jgi:OPA family sugar phosphate sensor protein UhpC-like MFS transporter
MGLYSFYRISKPSAEKVPQDRVNQTYRSLRRKTFWGVTVAYSLYYVCRTCISLFKKPLIDEGVLTEGQLGLVGAAFLFVYAVGKFLNGFIADYCNIRRFMATGLFISSVVNLLMAALGFFHNMIPSVVIFLAFAILWGMNGMVQSMGSAPGVISLSRWFPLSKRGSYYSIFSTSPSIGKFVSYLVLGAVGYFGWQYGFIVASIAGVIGATLILIMVSDTPESKGLPSVQELSGETLTKTDKKPTKELQKMVLKHPGVWVIAFSSAFLYITKEAVDSWGVLFLQEARGLTQWQASQALGYSVAFTIAGTLLAGWLSDKVFRGDRAKPALLSGILCTTALVMFLFVGGGFALNIFYVSLFSFSMGVLYCVVAGLMAVDIVPRKATGAALGVVGISSYIASGLQDITSGYMIQYNTTEIMDTAGNVVDKVYDFGPVSWFWIAASIIAFALPILNWKKMKTNTLAEQADKIK